MIVLLGAKDHGIDVGDELTKWLGIAITLLPGKSMKEFEGIGVEGWPPLQKLNDGSADWGRGVIGPSSEDIERFNSLRSNIEPTAIRQGESLTWLNEQEVDELTARQRDLRFFDKAWQRAGSLLVWTKNPLVRRAAAGMVVSLSVAATCGDEEGDGQQQPRATPTNTPNPERGLPSRQFLDQPFARDPGMKLQQAWIATDGLEHKGADYILGDLDNSRTWRSFGVLAAADGRACANPANRQGEAVFIEHNVAGRTMRTYYGHLAQIEPGIPPCESGQKKPVGRGDKVGIAGATGADSPNLVHLHFQVNDEDDNPVDAYDLRGKRDIYPDPNFTNGKVCGPNHLWVYCPTKVEPKPIPTATPRPTATNTPIRPSPGPPPMAVTFTPTATRTAEVTVTATPERPPLTEGPWPMYNGNAQHTGRSPYVGPIQPISKWRFSDYILRWPTSPIINREGTIFIASRDVSSVLFALNPDGTVRWRFPAGNAAFNTLSEAAVASDGTVYVHVGGPPYCSSLPCPSADGLYALRSDGSIKWFLKQRETPGWSGGRVIAAAVIGRDNTIYFSGGESFYAVNPDGTQKWVVTKRYSGDGSTPALALDGAVYVASCATPKLHAIDASGGEKWEVPIPGAGCSTPAIGQDGTIYVTAGVNLYAISPAGTLKWKDTLGTALALGDPSIGVDGTVYAGRNRLWAVNANGSVKWVFDGSLVPESCRGEGSCNFVRYSTPIIDASGTIYVQVAQSGGRPGSWLYAVDANGREKWVMTISDKQPPDTISPAPSMGADGTIYVGSGGIMGISAVGGK